MFEIVIIHKHIKNLGLIGSAVLIYWIQTNKQKTDRQAKYIYIDKHECLSIHNQAKLI